MGRKYSIDVLRLIAAFFIIIIHTDGELSATLPGMLKLFSRWGVLVFFMITGYFLAIGSNGSQTIKIEGIKKLIGVYIIGNIVYYPVLILKYIFWGVGYIPPVLELLIYGAYWHLWYLGSCIFGILTIWYFLLFNQKVLLAIISISILLFAVFASSYSLILDKQFSFEFYRFLLAVPFLYTGVLLASLKDAAIFPRIASISLLIIGFVIQLGEGLFFSLNYGKSLFDQQLLFGTTLLSLGIFLATLSWRIPKSRLSELGRKYSLFLYMYHPLVMLLQNLVLRKYFFVAPNSMFVLSATITFLLTLLIAIYLDKRWNRGFQVLNGIIFKAK